MPSLQHFPNVQATAQGGGGGWRSGAKGGWVGGPPDLRSVFGVVEQKTAGAKGTSRRARPPRPLAGFISIWSATPQQPLSHRRRGSAGAGAPGSLPLLPPPPPRSSPARPPTARAFVWPRGALGASGAGNWWPEEANRPAWPPLMSRRSRGVGAERPGPECPHGASTPAQSRPWPGPAAPGVHPPLPYPVSEVLQLP